MIQNRPAPAFQEYAASMMAKTEYRILNLAQRGLMMTIRLECWVNFRLPADEATLARVIGVDVMEVKQALPAIMPFFAINDGHLVCPELDDYRAYLQSIKDKKAEGGKRGAAITNASRKTAKPVPKQGVDANTGNPRLSCDSLGKLSSVKPSKTQSLESGESIDHQWVSDYKAVSKGY